MRVGQPRVASDLDPVVQVERGVGHVASCLEIDIRGRCFLEKHGHRLESFFLPPPNGFQADGLRWDEDNLRWRLDGRDVGDSGRRQSDRKKMPEAGDPQREQARRP